MLVNKLLWQPGKKNTTNADNRKENISVPENKSHGSSKVCVSVLSGATFLIFLEQLSIQAMIEETGASAFKEPKETNALQL